MIAVIADDFTGAAEIGGIGLRHGLSVVIETERIHNNQADILIIATDTRSLPEKEAAETTMRITRELMNLNPVYIYKKIDSALRGNIARELLAQMEVMNKRKAIVIAANPIFKRTIHEGIYSIDGIPLNKTNFSCDPEYPISTASVKEIIGKNKYPICTGLSPWDSIPETGIIAGDVNNFGDMEAWAQKIDSNTIPAGSSGFFNELLKKEILIIPNPTDPKIPYGDKSLYVLGSTFPKNDNFLTKIADSGYYISNMPTEIFFNKEISSKWVESWVNDIVEAFTKHNKIFLTVSYEISNQPGISSRIKETIGQVIEKTIQKTKINELIIEGGGTTSIVLNHLNVQELTPIHEIETGIIRMKMKGLDGIYLTTKPGSYNWPDRVWKTSDTSSLI